MKQSKLSVGWLALATLIALSSLSACGKKKEEAAAPLASSTPAPAQAAPASAPAQPAPAASVPEQPVASTDPDSPTPLPALQIKGVGIKKQLTYYYAFNGGVGTIKVTAVAKNAPSGATQALAFGLYDLKANKLCSESHGNTNSDKTIVLDCHNEKAQPLILRLDLGEETIDYSVALEGPVELPAAQAPAASTPVAAAGSTDIDEPTRLSGNRIKGSGIKSAVSYYYTFNAGPGELIVTGDGKNTSAAVTDALKLGLYTMRSERLCEVSLGNATMDKRSVMTLQARSAPARDLAPGSEPGDDRLPRQIRRPLRFRNHHATQGNHHRARCRRAV